MITTIIEIYQRGQNNIPIVKIKKVFTPFSTEKYLQWLNTNVTLQQLEQQQSKCYIDIIFEEDYSQYSYAQHPIWGSKPHEWHITPIGCHRINILRNLASRIEAMNIALSPTEQQGETKL